MLLRLEIFLMTLPFFVIIYFLAKRKRAAEKKNRDEMWLLIDENVGKRINDGLYLAGTGTDENSDFKVSQAIKKAELSSNARIVIYDRN